MNSFRIGVIGVLVEYWGEEMAEGFLHDFEGWVVFMACAGVLLVEMWILAKIGKDRMPFRDAFALEMPAPLPNDLKVRYRKLGAPFYTAFMLIVGMVVVSQVLPSREEIIPERTAFANFPEQVADWQGDMDRLEPIFIDTLKLDDHLLATYRNGEGDAVNLYVAYYGSQRKGASVHSPKTCLPGGGWQIAQFGQKVLEGVTVNGNPLAVNRTVIQLGEAKQLVYYWFQQRGRVITNEYLLKWYLFWDALTKNRTDGSLVRLTATIGTGQDVAEVDHLLESFARDVTDKIGKFVPD
jgi:exosortase D (VPLPA-CTERM-specific)